MAKNLEENEKNDIFERPTLIWPIIEYRKDLRHRLIDAAKAQQWSYFFEEIEKEDSFINATRPLGLAKYAPLHHAAYGGAPRAVVEQLIEAGAWRTLRDAHGNRPVDIAQHRGQNHLLPVLQPTYCKQVEKAVLDTIETYFHATVLSYSRYCPIDKLLLPQIEPLLEHEDAEMFYRVPGLYGGISYRFDFDQEVALISTGSSRMSWGVLAVHRITVNGVEDLRDR